MSRQENKQWIDARDADLLRTPPALPLHKVVATPDL